MLKYGLGKGFIENKSSIVGESVVGDHEELENLMEVVEVMNELLFGLIN